MTYKCSFYVCWELHWSNFVSLRGKKGQRENLTFSSHSPLSELSEWSVCCRGLPQHFCLSVTLWWAGQLMSPPNKLKLQQTQAAVIDARLKWTAVHRVHSWLPGILDCSLHDRSIQTIFAEWDSRNPLLCFIFVSPWLPGFFFFSSFSPQDVPDKRGSCGGWGPDWLAISEVCGERRSTGPFLRHRYVTVVKSNWRTMVLGMNWFSFIQYHCFDFNLLAVVSFQLNILSLLRFAVVWGYAAFSFTLL